MNGSEFQEIWRALHDLNVRLERVEKRLQEIEDAYNTFVAYGEGD